MENLLQNINFLNFMPIKELKFLNSPTEFFSELKSLYKTSRNAYAICLYTGFKEYTKELLGIIRERMDKGMPTKIIVDANRMKRIKATKDAILEAGVLEAFHFYDPMENFWLPPKLKELFCVLHTKLFIFDETVIITGANFEDSYMVNRLDRYAVINDKNFSVDITNLFFNFLDGKLTQPEQAPHEFGNSETVIARYDNKFEKRIISEIMNYEFDELFLSTGYFNLPDEYFPILMGKNIKTLIPSAKTSTYSQTKVFEGSINAAYEYFALLTNKKLKSMTIYEHTTPDFTFHCKGIWAFNKDFVVILLGSSNYNVRSLCRDIETNFIVVSKDPKIINNIKIEREGIFSRAVIKNMDKDFAMEVSLFSKIFAFIMKRFL